MKFNLIDKVIACLKAQPEKRLTGKEIGEWVLRKYPEECREKQQRSKAKVQVLNTESALISQIAAEISSRTSALDRKIPEIMTTGGRPRRYYFTTLSDSSAVQKIERKNSGQSRIGEHDLYPMLSEFLWNEIGLYSKRIDERKSSNKLGVNGNRWLYPDLVGLEDLSHEWHREIKDCVQQYFDKKSKLWSMEVKLIINGSNVRESFFQTVSNSAWANYGYLVAGEIQGLNSMRELQILSGLHGIGVIKIDQENISESQILIPARERMDIDWNTANRLAEANKDFLSYIKSIRQFYQTGEVKRTDWHKS